MTVVSVVDVPVVVVDIVEVVVMVDEDTVVVLTVVVVVANTQPSVQQSWNILQCSSQ